MARFIFIQNKAVNVDRIAYIDFLESGRAMVFVSGLTQEKQHIPIEPAEAVMLRDFLEREYAMTANMPKSAAAPFPAIRSLSRF